MHACGGNGKSPSTHHAINITRTKVNRARVHGFSCKYLGEASIRMYKCARVLEMAIAPITHYAINITLTKVNCALAHDQLVQEGAVSMHMS